MGLFQRNPHRQTESHALYSIGQEKTVLIVGLGNPGKEYDGTRHNIGFACLDAFAATHEIPAWTEKKDLKSLTTSHNLGGTRVILVKPTTFMNLSGEAVQAVAHFYKIAASDMAVVHDELDIPFGQIRLRTGGSAAGHNGLKSVLQHFDEGFGRVRIGIGSETKMDAKDFVLAKFSKEEQGQLKSLEKEVVSILTEYAVSGELPQETRSFLL
jgi:PTH1 family peptidyl-tRNA hydrolase